MPWDLGMHVLIVRQELFSLWLVECLYFQSINIIFALIIIGTYRLETPEND